MKCWRRTTLFTMAIEFALGLLTPVRMCASWQVQEDGESNAKNQDGLALYCSRQHPEALQEFEAAADGAKLGGNQAVRLPFSITLGLSIGPREL